MATSLTQHGVTWTFDADYTTGQFVNGDYYVIDSGSGVNITSISPGASTGSVDGRDINGSMINPSGLPQGYDESENYSAVNNVAIGVSAGSPLTLNAGESLVSTISVDPYPGSNASYVESAAVLTCLGSAPAANSFRPGISGTTKTIHNESDINTGLLPTLTVPSGTSVDLAHIATYAGYLQMVWLDHGEGSASREMHPANGLPDNYYYFQYFGIASLMLVSDFTYAQKRDLLINYIQIAIDLYSYIESGGEGWMANGGHGNGRKWPILFAGMLLDYAPMKNIGQYSGAYLYSGDYWPAEFPPNYVRFGEDEQTFYVSQYDIDVTNNSDCISASEIGLDRVTFDSETNTFAASTTCTVPAGGWDPDLRNRVSGVDIRCRPYNSSMLGMPEWGIRHAASPRVSDSSWLAMYRRVAQYVWPSIVISIFPSGGR